MSKIIDIIDEVQQNFVDSSYDVNTNRAFPNVADGLKPGQRACLWEMYTKKYLSSKPHVKSAKIDGGVAALWWPHGTSAIYETFARMSQPFTNNSPLVDFHGANGNIILGGDALAADRYTEARLSSLCEEGMLEGINKNTVDMQLNFSEDEEWPTLLPAVFPNLLVNGAQGIGVSVANVWLPHSFTDTANLILKYLKEDILDEDNYYPDFPTGGTIINKDELSVINKTGRGKVVVQAKYTIQGQSILFTEMPYQVYIEPVIEKIKEQIEKENLVGISDVINKSDKKRILLVVECEKGFSPETVVESLFANTTLQSQYNANQNGIVSKTPVLLNLKEVVDVYVKHNTTCIRREHEFDFEKAKSRIEILEGLLKATASINKVVSLIQNSKDSAEAKKHLIQELELSENQAKAVLDMKLVRLSGLDSLKLNEELEEKKKVAEFCNEVVHSEDKQKEILIERLSALAKKYGKPRKTGVVQKDIVKVTKAKAKKEEIPQDIVVTFDGNYIKAIPVAQYRAKKNSLLLSEFKTTTMDLIYCFSSLGKVYRITAKDIGLCGNADKGKAIAAILKMEQGETIRTCLSNKIDEKHPYLTFVTKGGMVKRSEKSLYLGTTRNLNGIKAIGLVDSDSVLFVKETNGDIISIMTHNKYCLSFKLDEIRVTGKTAKGMIGIKLTDGDYVIGMAINNLPKGSVVQKRGGKGRRVVK